MRSRTYRTEGIILKRVNIGEADRLLTVFTRSHGKIRCIAHGVRRPTSRKSASVELFCHSTLFLARGKNIDIVTQAETFADFSQIRKHLKAAKAAYHVVELVDLLTAEGQENHQVYDELVGILQTINDQGQATRRQISEFERNILVELGFGTPKKESQASLRTFIESIIERHLKTVEIFKDV